MTTDDGGTADNSGVDLTTRLDQAKRDIASFDLRSTFGSPVDLLIGLALAASALLGAAVTTKDPAIAPGLLLATAPQVLRRTYPWVTVGLTFAGAVLLVMFPSRPDVWLVPVLLSGALSFHTIQRQLDRPAAWVFAAVLTFAPLGVVVFALWARSGVLPETVAAAAGVTVLLWGITLFADAGRSRTEVRQARTDTLETLREQAAMAERARIAREMHDIVAHSISMVAVQAETAPYTVKDLSGDAAREFAQIAAAARGTLTEMRRLLGVLRADVPPETAPQPGLARLPELIAQHDGEVDLDVVGEEHELPQAVDVSAYRIVQEALTNARTHAPGARVSIEIAYRPTLLALRIADDGPGPPPTPPEGADEGRGHGLIGMRERATALGGWFVAERGPAGGFLIRAGLPTE
ncbi:histidine kinase [Microbispora sp. NPDC049125]|uniref:histidine kinase n=1 Tax=Microbispora sp. NPDC049125 TaxID=3154929 RepID=UPI0034664499